MSNTNDTRPPVEGSMDATLAWSGDPKPKQVNATSIYITRMGNGSIRISGSNYVDDQQLSTDIDIWLPEATLGEREYQILPGEGTTTGANLATNEIPRQGYAKSGKIQVTKWNPATGAFAATFEFIVQDDVQNDTAVKGSVSVANLNDRSG